MTSLRRLCAALFLLLLPAVAVPAAETLPYQFTSATEPDRVFLDLPLPPPTAANPAALVAVSFVPGESGYMGDTPADELGEMWGAYDCGLASSYFILAAKNHGWDTLIMGIRDKAKVKSILGIPEKEVLMSVIAVGKSAQPYFKNPRKPVAEVLKVM